MLLSRSTNARDHDQDLICHFNTQQKNDIFGLLDVSGKKRIPLETIEEL